MDGDDGEGRTLRRAASVRLYTGGMITPAPPSCPAAITIPILGGGVDRVCSVKQMAKITQRRAQISCTAIFRVAPSSGRTVGITAKWN